MSYFTGLNRSWEFIPKNGEKICEISYNNRIFVVYQYGGRYYLYRNEYQLSEIVSGHKGFVKQYKGDYLKWIEKVEKKDKEKIMKLRAMAQKVIEDANKIESIWL
jgi:hypothetical protein